MKVKYQKKLLLQLIVYSLQNTVPDGQKAMHMSRPCNMHRWAQTTDVKIGWNTSSRACCFSLSASSSFSFCCCNDSSDSCCCFNPYNNNKQHAGIILLNFEKCLWICMTVMGSIGKKNWLYLGDGVASLFSTMYIYSGADFSPLLTENLFLVLKLSTVSSNTLYHGD